MNLLTYYNPKRRNLSPFESLFEGAWRNLSAIEPLLGVSKEAIRNPVVFQEKDAGYELRIEIPGYSKKEVSVEIDQSVLSVIAFPKSAEKTASQVELQKRFQLPEGINYAKSKASLDNGVLTVHCPKKDSPKPLKIKVS